MLPRTVDRSTARLIAYKRIITGSLSLAAGVAMVTVGVMHGPPTPPALILAVLIFFGGGAWTLRDGIRLRRELLR